MPSIEVANLKQDAVLWPNNGYDAYGNPKVSGAVPIKVRWRDTHREIVAPDGNTIAIDATATVPFDIAVDSIMWLGYITDLGFGILSPGGPPIRIPPKDAMLVKDFKRVPDIKGRKFRRTVQLMRAGDKLPNVLPT